MAGIFTSLFSFQVVDSSSGHRPVVDLRKDTDFQFPQFVFVIVLKGETAKICVIFVLHLNQ